MLNLREKDHTSIDVIAGQCFKTPIEIWAYGSRVNGDSHDASDLDLVLSFKEHLQKSNIPILVQVMDWNKIPKCFHENILKKYEVIYSNKSIIN